MDILLSPTSKERSISIPKQIFRIKEDWAGLRIGFTEPTIWTSWRKSGRINADAERFMVRTYIYTPSLSYLFSAHGWAGRILARMTVLFRTRASLFCWDCRGAVAGSFAPSPEIGLNFRLG